MSKHLILSGRCIWMVLVLLAAGKQLQAQDRCSIERYEAWLDKTHPGRESSVRFEKWMTGQLRAPRLMGTQSALKIPVVVHIIHNGEAVGTGTNLSTAQIESQIAVLNRDFNRTNADATLTPTEFQNTAGQLAVEFVLARRTPDGLPTDGIVRINGSKSGWALSEENIFKALSYWPAEDYLNMWVLNLTGGDIGYASFPISNLPGLGFPGDNRLTDGVIVDYITVGSVEDGNFNLDNRFNKGRTATHEIGHFLGLRHIWGDGTNCQASDFVDDTPPQSSETTGCPAHPQVSCSTPKMFQNYMDYTNDACMNLFTAGQVARMNIVLSNSPRRLSLTTSLGGLPPVFAVDAAVRLVAPTASVCPGTLEPAVEVRGIGTEEITSVRIRLSIGQATETRTFAVKLSQGERDTVYFTTAVLAAGATQTFEAEVLEVNGASDELASNNRSTVTALTTTLADLPLLEEFTDAPFPEWTVTNPDNSFTWAHQSAGGSMAIKAYDYDQTGESDALLTPLFDATGQNNLLLQFDVAYARFPGNNDERLTVLLVDDCSNGLSGGEVIYEKEGNDLATAPDNYDGFVPRTADWRRETVALNAWANRPNLRLAFVFHSNYGNNIYLDRVRLAVGEIVNLSVVTLTEPSPVSCSDEVVPKVRVKNLGSVALQGLRYRVTLNGNTLPEMTVSTVIPAGGDEVVPLAALSLAEGGNDLTVSASPVSGNDEDPGDNIWEGRIHRNPNRDRLPARYDFDSGTPWNVASRSGSLNWQQTDTDRGTSMVFPSFGEESFGEESWLVSPVMDFRRVSTAALFFDFSYALRTENSERLKVLASGDCGTTFDQVLLDSDAAELSDLETSGEWEPDGDADWSRKFINLNTLTGRNDVLLAFVVTGAGDNNLFLDNIEFYTSDDPDPETITESFRVYTDEFGGDEKITFNLSERSTVRLQIITSTGLPVLDNTYSDILNQTLTFRLDRPTGIYVYRLFIGDKVYALRHLVR